MNRSIRPSTTIRSALFTGLGLAALLAAAPGPAAAAPRCGEERIAVAADCFAVADLADGIRRAVAEAMARDRLKSAIVAVSVNGRPVLTEAWGESLAGVPATPDMRFRNGAIAIAYLTTLLLQLRDDGRVSLDDPLAKWFPDYPKADRITLRMLADSTAGYADYVQDLPIYADVFRQWKPEELVAHALANPMRCEPGACFAYSHANYVILGEVLRRVTGLPVEAQIRRRILEPLSLNATRSDATAAIPSPVLHAFTDERGVYEDSTYWNPSWTLARGAVMTTDIRDALASFAAIGDGSLVSPDSHTRMLAPTTAAFPPMSLEAYYGLGVLVTNGWVMQTPSFGGYAAAVGYLPERRIGIAVSVTMGPNSPDARHADRIALALATRLAPDQPPKLPGR